VGVLLGVFQVGHNNQKVREVRGKEEDGGGGGCNGGWGGLMRAVGRESGAIQSVLDII
jgi:hypothetical protein